MPPFGIVPGLWREAVERGSRLADTLADDDDRSPEVAAQAAELQALLRPRTSRTRRPIADVTETRTRRRKASGLGPA